MISGSIVQEFMGFDAVPPALEYTEVHFTYLYIAYGAVPNFAQVPNCQAQSDLQLECKFHDLSISLWQLCQQLTNLRHLNWACAKYKHVQTHAHRIIQVLICELLHESQRPRRCYSTSIGHTCHGHNSHSWLMTFVIICLYTWSVFFWVSQLVGLGE